MKKVVLRYQQTLEIHQRVETVLRLIGTGNFSTPALPETIGVSIPTICRLSLPCVSKVTRSGQCGRAKAGSMCLQKANTRVMQTGSRLRPSRRNQYHDGMRRRAVSQFLDRGLWRPV